MSESDKLRVDPYAWKLQLHTTQTTIEKNKLIIQSPQNKSRKKLSVFRNN